MINSNIQLADIPLNANKSLKNIPHIRNAIRFPTRTIALYLFIGSLILNNTIKPIMHNSIVAAVATSAEDRPNTFPHHTMAPTAIKSVSPAGNALRKTLIINFPLIRLLLGSMARKNAGIPIVNPLINDI